MRKEIILSLLWCLILFAGSARADVDGGAVDLSRWLYTVEAPATAEGLKPAAGLIPMEPGEKPYLFVRMLPTIDIIDGGPNIDHATVGSDRYKDAFAHGYGLNVEIWGRFLPNINFVFQFGTTRFEGGRRLRTIDGYDYHLSDMPLVYLAIGGSFSAPLSLLFKGEQEKTDDMAGLLGYFTFCGGVVYQPPVDMTVDSSPPLGVDLTGMRLDYWKARAGFVGNFSIGIEYRVGPFCLFTDIGIRTFGKPISATDPSWWGAADVMLTYPIRAGVGYRF